MFQLNWMFQAAETFVLSLAIYMFLISCLFNPLPGQSGYPLTNHQNLNLVNKDIKTKSCVCDRAGNCHKAMVLGGLGVMVPAGLAKEQQLNMKANRSDPRKNICWCCCQIGNIKNTCFRSLMKESTWQHPDCPEHSVFICGYFQSCARVMCISLSIYNYISICILI